MATKSQPTRPFRSLIGPDRIAVQLEQLAAANDQQRRFLTLLMQTQDTLLDALGVVLPTEAIFQLDRLRRDQPCTVDVVDGPLGLPMVVRFDTRVILACEKQGIVFHLIGLLALAILELEEGVELYERGVDPKTRRGRSVNLRERAGRFGIEVQRYGPLTYWVDSPFTELLAEMGISGPRPGEFLLEEPKARTQERAWVCECGDRVASKLGRKGQVCGVCCTLYRPEDAADASWMTPRLVDLDHALVELRDLLSDR